MAKLNQIIAIEKGVKSRAYGEIGELHKTLQKTELFNGFAKEYLKLNDDGEDLPAEKKRVQFVVRDVLRAVGRLSTEWFEVTARKDWTNCVAKGSVEIDGQLIVEDAPVSFLLFLEKQLTDLRTMIVSIPVLDEAESWTLDANSGLYKSEPAKTHRTKKVQRAIVLYNATPEHPAQTQLITEDMLVGHWQQIRHSGAMPKPEKEKLLERVDKLLRAVKEAREGANITDVVDAPNVGAAMFGYLLGD